MEKKKLKLLVCALAIGLCVSLANADIETGLVGHWTLDDGSGDTAIDSSGNGNDGTLTVGSVAGLPEWKTTGEDFRVGTGALAFEDGNAGNGEGNLVDCGADPVFDITENITLALWVKIDAFTAQYQYVFSKGTSYMFLRAGGSRYLRVVFNGLVKPNHYAGGTTIPIDDGQWHHIAGSYDSSTGIVAFYTDGILEESKTTSGSIPISSESLCIGRRNEAGRKGTNAIIDDVRLYNRTLSEDDIFALWVSDPDFNFAPKVNAGDYQSILWPDNTAQLDATVSDDGKPADPCQVTITWSKLSGPGAVAFSDTTIEDPTATFSVAGMYELRLRGYDGEKDACDVVAVYIRPNDDPIAHWDFDEGSGLTVNDDSANNNIGERAGDSEPNWVSGWVGSGAMEFFGVERDTTSSYVNITTDDTIDPNLDNLQYAVTLAAWFKIGDLANTYHPAIVANSNTGWRLYVETPTNDLYGKVTFTPGDSLSGPRAYSTRPMDDGYWHHVVGIYDGSKSYLYVDGVLDVTVDNAGLLDTTDGVPVSVGARNRKDDFTVERSWNGLIDDVRVYSYSLSASQVADLAAMGSLIPVVDAGADQVFSVQDDYVQLDGTVIDDGNPVAATIEWTKTSGPGDVVFSDTAIEDPTATFSEVGTYVLRLTADDTMAAVYDEVTITVENPTCQDVIDNGLLIIGDFSGPDGTPDCYINLYDFAAFAGNWLKCNDPQDPACDFPY